MMTRHNAVRVPTVMIALVLTWGAPLAREIRLSEMTREDEVILQRGYHVPDVMCGFAIIAEIEAYGGEEAMRDFTVDLDAEVLTFRSGSMDLFHTCEDGVHTMHDGGEEIVMQRYDEDGQPTMMEP